MKKLLVTLLATVLTVSGCSSVADENFKDEPAFMSFTGIVEKQKNTDPESGTHFLIDAVGKKVAVRSLNMDLNGGNYLGNKIDAVGVLISSEDVFEITDASVVEVLNVPEIEAEDEAEEKEEDPDEMATSVEESDEVDAIDSPVLEDAVVEGDVDSEDPVEEVVVEEEVSSDSNSNFDLRRFDSKSFNFAGEFPASWYYAGSKGEGDSLRHYGFGEEPDVDVSNEIVGLDLVSGDVPAGLDADGLKVNADGSVEAFVEVEGQTYKFYGPGEYGDLVSAMAKSVSPLDPDEEESVE